MFGQTCGHLERTLAKVANVQIKKSSSASSNLILKNNISDDSTNLAGAFLEQIKMGLKKTVTIDKSKPFIK